ncbi:hypothetical protein MMC25_004001 [Agyrium rufum]|nr:hypothetical protein [Agyrium rufum]
MSTLSELRSRPTTTSAKANPDIKSAETDPRATFADGDFVSKRIGVLDVLRIIGGLFLLSSALSYFVTNDSILWGYRPAFTVPAQITAWMVSFFPCLQFAHFIRLFVSPNDYRLLMLQAFSQKGPVLLTDSELLLYNGTRPSLPIYLALNGTIYDVSTSPQTYGPGGSYHFFAGRDASRAFVTGCFQTDLTPDMRGVEEMYVPLDLDTEPSYIDGEGHELGKEERRKMRAEWKSKKAQAWKKGRERAMKTIAGWQSRFETGKNQKGYFEVGRVVREEGWLEKMEKRELCPKAKEARPKNTPTRKAVEIDAEGNPY